MQKNRLEAFSDGVIAILITIMVLELAAPEETTPQALLPLIPVFLSYLFSFLVLGIYWNNHHHLFQSIEKVNGRVLWGNTNLLFWMSLIPFATAWVGKNPFSPWPVAAYGMVFLLASIAYYILTNTLIGLHGGDSILGRAVGRNYKGITSLAIYACAIPLSFVSVWLAYALYFLNAIWWLVPDRRIEKEVLAGQ